MRLPIIASNDGYRIERPTYAAHITNQGELQFRTSGASTALHLRTGAVQRGAVGPVGLDVGQSRQPLLEVGAQVGVDDPRTS